MTEAVPIPVTISKQTPFTMGLGLAILGVVVVPAVMAYWTLDGAVDELKLEMRTGFRGLTTEVRAMQKKLEDYDNVKAALVRLETENNMLKRRVESLEKRN